MGGIAGHAGAFGTLEAVHTSVPMVNGAPRRPKQTRHQPTRNE